MVSMARKTGFTTGNVSCYYSIASTMNFFAIASRHATAPFVVDVSRLKPLAAPALTGDTFGCGLLPSQPDEQFAHSPFFLPVRECGRTLNHLPADAGRIMWRG